MYSAVRHYLRLWKSRFKNRHYRRNQELFRLACSNLAKEFSSPLFVKVGANDGITGDPCSDILLTDSRWRGILIEPVPYLFEKLQESFGDKSRFVLEQVAIGPDIARSTFYGVDVAATEQLPNLPVWYDQIGSFDRNHILKHFGESISPFIFEIQVDVIPLDEVFRRHEVSQCQLLHIDTEGFDLKVLKTLNLENIRPVVIYIEHKHLPANEKNDLIIRFSKYRYELRDCGDDFLAIDKEFSKRLLAK
jgi:FkbM family methyltransferase